jgi:dGTPase
MISSLVVDLTEHSRKQIRRHRPTSLEDVRRQPTLIAFSATVKDEQQELQRFLRQHLYQHYQVVRMTAKAQRIVTDLFQAFVTSPRLLPAQYQGSPQTDVAHTAADYIAGMTDRYAIREHRRLFAVDET